MRKRLVLVAAAVVVALLAPGCLRAYVFARLPGPVLGREVPPAGVASLSAEACGACHAEIAAEWRASRMAQAWTNKLFQADFAAQGEPYVCRYCHTPLVEQQPQVVTGLASLKPVRGEGHDNVAYDEALRDEGVNCAACHVRSGAVVGPLGGTAAPHAVTVDPEFASVERCAPCHQSPAPPFTGLSRPLLDVVAEWTEWKLVTGRQESCVDCHMPSVTRPLTAYTGPRQGRRHTFPGGWDDRLLSTALRLERVERTPAGVVVVVTNLAGHRLPTSDPMRSLSLRATLATVDGRAPQSTVAIDRRVDFPAYEERWDTTLAPGETRAVVLPFQAADLGLSTGADVSAWFTRVAHGSAEVRALDPGPVKLSQLAATW